MTSWECDYLYFHGHRNGNGNCYSPTGVEYTFLQGRRVLQSELFTYDNHFVLFWPILLFSPCWRRWKNTWEACFTTENLKTWREGMNENNLASFLSMHFICHSLEELMSYFPYKLNCTIYFYASLNCMSCDKAGNEHVLLMSKTWGKQWCGRKLSCISWTAVK